MTQPTKYIELDSAYRNRNLYPQPADFVVDISQSGVKTRAQAQDVVSDAAPILVWNNSFVENNTNSNSINISTNPSTIPVYSGNDVCEIISIPVNVLRKIDNFYVGALLYLSSVNIIRRIIGYKFLISDDAVGSSTGLVYLENTLPNNFPVGQGGAIISPTPIPTNTANSIIKFYIPNSSYIDNFYKNYYIQSLDTGEYKLITEYDGTTHLATLDSATSIDWASTANAMINFAIRKNIPINSGELLAISTDGFIIQLASTANNISDIYIGSFFYMIEPLPTDTTGYSTEISPYNESKRIVRYIAGNGTFLTIAPLTNSFTLSQSASMIDEYYINCFITNTVTGETRQIDTYIGSTRSGTVTSNWGAGAPGNRWIIRSIFLESPFTNNPVVGSINSYQIEQFSNVNVNPFNYTGSLVSVSEEVCCEIKLLNLIIPNLTLSSSGGGRPAFYPYFYVLFEPVGSTGGQQKNILNSNNPSANGKLFRCPADDTPTPLISTFIKIDGDNTSQIIKFKPTQSGFHFAVYCPDGSLFETVEQDTVSPVEPNPNVQISACFSFKRI